MTAPQPLVSIVLPTYNRPELLPVAVESILKQSYPAIELIIVDNGSAEETRRVLARWRDEPKVRIVTVEKNGGVYKAYNVGLPFVRGKYATFMYDDDALLPDAIEYLVGQAEELGPSYGFVFGDCIDPADGQRTGLGLTARGPVDFPAVISGRISGEFSGIWRMDAFGARRFREGLLGAEGLVWWDMYRTTLGYYVGRPIRHYLRNRPDSISKVRIDPDWIAQSAATLDAYLLEFGADWERLAPSTLVDRLLRSAVWDLLDARPARSREKLLRAMRLAGPGKMGAAAAAGMVGTLMPTRLARELMRARVAWRAREA